MELSSALKGLINAAAQPRVTAEMGENESTTTQTRETNERQLPLRAAVPTAAPRRTIAHNLKGVVD